MNIRLLVLRTADMKALVDFYTMLGMSFTYHKHGNSPFHYSANINEAIFEIYPLANGQFEVDKNLRLGFDIDFFDKAIELLNKCGTSFLSQPVQTDFGFTAIVADPDGRKIELYRK